MSPGSSSNDQVNVCLTYLKYACQCPLGYLSRCISPAYLSNLFLGYFAIAHGATQQSMNATRMFLSGGHSAFGFGVSHVIYVCSSEQMTWIYARWIVAFMAGMKRKWIDAIDYKHGYTCRAILRAMMFPPKCEATVAIRECSLPRPTFIESPFVYLRPKPFEIFCGKLRDWFTLVHAHVISFSDRVGVGSLRCSSAARPVLV